jgi:hypothetical protein
VKFLPRRKPQITAFTNDQNIGAGSNGIGADGTVALGKISVTASVSVAFRLQPQ